MKTSEEIRDLEAKAFEEGFNAGIHEEQRKYIEAIRTMSDHIKELEDKHWEECRQIALYDDELRKAMKLLSRVKAVHAAAIRNGDAAVSSLTGRLMHDANDLYAELKRTEATQCRKDLQEVR